MYSKILFKHRTLRFDVIIMSTVWYGTPSTPANITYVVVLGPMSPYLPAKAALAAVAECQGMGLRVKFLNATGACGAGLTGCTDGCASHPGVIGHRNMYEDALAIV